MEHPPQKTDGKTAYCPSCREHFPTETNPPYSVIHRADESHYIVGVVGGESRKIEIYRDPERKDVETTDQQGSALPDPRVC